MSIVGYLTLNMGWSIPIIGAKGDVYSPIILTNIGSLGLTAGFAPMPPMAAMIVACMGAVTEKPWVVNGEIKIRKILTIVYSFDHRAGDGAILVRNLQVMNKMMLNPQLMERLEYDGNDIINKELLDTKKDK